MSFRCQQCSEVSQRPIYKVTKTRPQQYKNWKEVPDEETGKLIKEAVFSEGWEIVKAINICTKCNELITENTTSFIKQSFNGFPVIKLDGLMYK